MGLKIFLKVLSKNVLKEFYESNHVALVLTEILLFLWLKMAKNFQIRVLEFCRFLELLIEKCL